MSECIEKAIQIIHSLNIDHVSQATIFSVTHNGNIEDLESLNPSIEAIFNDTNMYETLLTTMREIRDSCNHQDFWDSLTNCDLPTNLFLPICFKLMKKSGKISRITCLLYATLLGMRPLHFSYNDNLVQALLKNMIVASQAVESKRALTEKESNYLAISCDLFDELSKAMNADFFETASVEVFTAFVELAFKLGSHVNKEILTYTPTIAESTLKFIRASFIVSYEHVLPYFVSTLLSDAIVRNVRTARFKQSILKIASEILHGKDSQLILVCQHLIVRCPDRAALRESVSQCVHFLFTFINDDEQLFAFLKKCCSNHKISLRSVACDVIRSLLVEEPQVTGENAEELCRIALILAKDVAPTVRGAAVGALSSITDSKERWNEAKENMNIEFVLKRRLRDEKIGVRRAALKFLKSALMITDQVDHSLLKMCAERTNDRSIIIRQEALCSLSDYFSRFPTEEVFSHWLECVLPRANDDDQKTVDLAITLIEKDFMGNIVRLNKLCSLITNDHIQMLTKAFQTMAGKERAVKQFTKVFVNFLRSSQDISPNMWIIGDALSKAVERGIFPKAMLDDFWKKRDELPYFFLSIISRENAKKEAWISDSISTLKNVAYGEATLSFGHIHYFTEIAVSKDGYKTTFQEIMKKCLREIKNYNGNFESVNEVSGKMFLLGEIILKLSTKNFDAEIITSVCYNENMPTLLRSIAVITLSKACLVNKELAQAVILHFSNDIIKEEPDDVKANQITALCDLCVHYTAMVDPFIDNIMKTIITDSPAVKRHAIISITRLIAEDYVKLRPTMFYKLMSILVCGDKEVSNFASNCLFDVLVPKNPKIMKSVSDSIAFFNGDDMQIFAVPAAKKRQMYQLVINRMSDVQLLEVIQQILVKYINPIVVENSSIASSNSILKDSLSVMGDAYENIINNASCASQQTDKSSDAELEASMKIMEYVHVEIAHKLIPSLVDLNKILKRANSELQSDLRRLLALIIARDPSLIEDISNIDQPLSAEVQDDANALIQEESVPPSPVMRRMFSSNLLSTIADRDKERSRSIAAVSQTASQDDFPIFEKRPPSAYESQDE